ncbi:MAG TPA: hypothetical protein VFT62_05880 [Mycobacteriales bacterium]|nr:hypothetical protein [Mycobacteriales bacterium]
MAWDRLSAKQLTTLQDRLVREQVQHAIAPFSPYWKRRFGELGTAPASLTSTEALARVPAVGERDVSPTADPAGMAGLVLQATEGGFALHAPGPTLRRALRLRLTERDEYRALVDEDTKPTSYVWSGLGFRYPIASTRGDLDVIARAGARLWQVVGIDGTDALLSALPTTQTAEHQALQFAALATGTPALFPGDRLPDVTAAARLAPPTALAVASSRAAQVITALADAAVPFDRLRTVLLVGAPSAAERLAAVKALSASTAPSPAAVAVLAVHAPAAARLLWGECRQAGADGGLHTYPDFDLVQTIDPDSGESVDGAGELVLTQLGLRGSALLRWRTGDLLPGGVDTAVCPGCRRQVPRLVGLRRNALVLTSDDGRALDLRAVAGALSGRTDLADWRVVVGGRRRDGRGQVVVHVVPTGDPGEAAVGAAGDVRTLGGLLPTQFVATTAAELAAVTGEPLTPRILRRS